MPNKRHVFFIILFSLHFSGCQVTPLVSPNTPAPENPIEATPAAPENEKAATEPPRASQPANWKLTYQTLIAELAFKRELYDQALSNFRYVLKYNQDIRLIKKAAIAALKTQNWVELKQWSEQWLQRQPSSKVQRLRAIAAINLQDNDAITQYNQVFEDESPSLEQIIQTWRFIQNYLSTNVANTFFNDHLEQLNFNAKLTYVIFLQQKNRYAQSEKIIEQYFVHSDDINIVKLKRNALQQQTKLLEIEAYLEQKLAQHSDNVELRTLYIETLIQQHQGDKAIAQIHYLQNHYPTDQSLQEKWDSVLGLLQWDLQRLDDAEKTFSQLSKQNKHPNLSAYYLGMIAQKRQQWQEAIDWLTQVSAQSAQYDAAQLALFDIYLTQKNYSQANHTLSILERSFKSYDFVFQQKQLQYLFATNTTIAEQNLAGWISKNPDDLRYRLLDIELHMNQAFVEHVLPRIQQHLQQLEDLEQQKQFIMNIPNMLSAQDKAHLYPLIHQLTEQHPEDIELRYFRGLSAEIIGNITQLPIDVTFILQKQPEHEQSLNALGYSLLERKQSLAQAEELIHKAYSLDPKDPAIIDSLGWLYFIQGNLDKAEYHLQTAYRLSDDVEIAVHLIEVLWKNNKPSQAQQLFKMMQQRFPNSTLLKPLSQRIPELS